MLEVTSQVKLHLTNHDSIVNQLLDKRASFQPKVSFRSVTVSCTSGTTCGAALESWQGGFHKFVVQNLSGFELKWISTRFLKFINQLSEETATSPVCLSAVTCEICITKLSTLCLKPGMFKCCCSGWSLVLLVPELGRSRWVPCKNAKHLRS